MKLNGKAKFLATILSTLISIPALAPISFAGKRLHDNNGGDTSPMEPAAKRRNSGNPDIYSDYSSEDDSAEPTAKRQNSFAGDATMQPRDIHGDSDSDSDYNSEEDIAKPAAKRLNSATKNTAIQQHNIADSPDGNDALTTLMGQMQLSSSPTDTIVSPLLRFTHDETSNRSAQFVPATLQNTFYLVHGSTEQKQFFEFVKQSIVCLEHGVLGAHPLIQFIENHPRPELLLNSEDEDGYTLLYHLLMWADESSEHRFNFFSLINKLIDRYGMNIEYQNKYGKTALHLLAECTENQNALKFLLMRKANPNALDFYGHTPLFYAENRNLQRSTGILHLHGGYKK